MREFKCRNGMALVVLFVIICSAFTGCGEHGKAATETDARKYVANLGYEKYEYVDDFFYPDKVIFRYHGYQKQDGYICKVDQIDVIYPTMDEGYGEPEVETEYYGTSWEGIVGTWKYKDSEREFLVTIVAVDDKTITVSYDLNGVERSIGVMSSEIAHVQSDGPIETKFGWHDDTNRVISIPEDGIWSIWVNGKNGVTIDGKYLNKAT